MLERIRETNDLQAEFDDIQTIILWNQFCQIITSNLEFLVVQDNKRDFMFDSVKGHLSQKYLLKCNDLCQRERFPVQSATLQCRFPISPAYRSLFSGAGVGSRRCTN